MENGKLRCAYCNKQLPEVAGKGRPPQYCSQGHRKAAYNLRRLELVLESEGGQRLLREAIDKVMEVRPR